MSEPKKRILVLSDPPAAPGYLPRLRYLCDYLVRQGHELTLVTEQYQPLHFAHTYPIITIPVYSGSKADWFIKTVWTLLTDWHNRAFAQKVLSNQKSKIKNQKYDTVICTAFSDFPLGAAQRIAKALQVPLLCDIRDLDEQVDDSQYQYHHQSRLLMPFRHIYRAIHIRRRNQVLRAANAITTVSPWHADFIKQFNPNVHVIYNGFDDKQFYPKDEKTDSFTVTYIGSLFEWQKPALAKVQQAIEELNKSKIENQKSKILWDFHTPQSNPIAHDHLGDAIRRSGIMLVLTNEQTHGMLTTKFYEALGCEKPILCVPSDKGALAELMAYTNAGLATDDIDAIKQFIMDRYDEWRQNGFTHQATQHRNEFTREAQYDQFYRTRL